MDQGLVPVQKDWGVPVKKPILPDFLNIGGDSNHDTGVPFHDFDYFFIFDSSNEIIYLALLHLLVPICSQSPPNHFLSCQLFVDLASIA